LEPGRSNYLFAPGEASEFKFGSPFVIQRDTISDSTQIETDRWSNTLQYEVISNIQERPPPEVVDGEDVVTAAAAEEDLAFRALMARADDYLPARLARRLTRRSSAISRSLEEERSISRLYLQLPDHRDMETVRELSGSWTTEGQDSFQKAKSIEYELKSRFGYTLDIDFATLPNHLSYFLTSAREGHCEYFATAMVLMLRTLGTPARIVNGGVASRAGVGDIRPDAPIGYRQ